MKKIYIFAAVLALITGVAVYYFANALKADATPQEIPTAQVVVTTVTIEEGTYITADMVTLVSIPTEYIAGGAVTTLGDVVGKVNKYRCMANQQVVFEQLGSVTDAAIKEGGRLSYTLPQGMRAMTVSTTEISGVAGYVNPGDRVDIVCAINTNATDSQGNKVATPTSMMLLENIQVLETGIITQKLTEGGETIMYTSATLALTPEQAVKLQYATSYGDITMLLRAVDDTEILEPEDYVGEATPVNTSSGSTATQPDDTAQTDPGM